MSTEVEWEHCHFPCLFGHSTVLGGEWMTRCDSNQKERENNRQSVYPACPYLVKEGIGD